MKMLYFEVKEPSIFRRAKGEVVKMWDLVPFTDYQDIQGGGGD